MGTGVQRERDSFLPDARVVFFDPVLRGDSRKAHGISHCSSFLCLPGYLSMDLSRHLEGGQEGYCCICMALERSVHDWVTKHLAGNNKS
jgi:hypothetical protein